MRALESPKVKKVEAPLGPAWQVTATVAGQRRKRQIYLHAWPAGVAERKARELVARWAAEQAQLKIVTHEVKTTLSTEEVRVAEQIFRGVPADATAEWFRTRVSVRLTNEQLTMAESVFKMLPGISSDQLNVRVAAWRKELERPQLALGWAVEAFLLSRKVQSAQQSTYLKDDAAAAWRFSRARVIRQTEFPVSIRFPRIAVISLDRNQSHGSLFLAHTIEPKRMQSPMAGSRTR